MTDQNPDPDPFTQGMPDLHRLAEGLLEYVESNRQDPAILAEHEQHLAEINDLCGALIALYMTSRLAGERGDMNQMAQAAMLMSLRLKASTPMIVHGVVGKILDLFITELVGRHGSMEEIARIANENGQIFADECEHGDDCRCPSKLNEIFNAG